MNAVEFLVNTTRQCPRLGELNWLCRHGFSRRTASMPCERSVSFARVLQLTHRVPEQSWHASFSPGAGGLQPARLKMVHSCIQPTGSRVPTRSRLCARSPPPRVVTPGTRPGLLRRCSPTPNPSFEARSNGPASTQTLGNRGKAKSHGHTARPRGLAAVTQFLADCGAAAALAQRRSRKFKRRLVPDCTAPGWSGPATP